MLHKEIPNGCKVFGSASSSIKTEHWISLWRDFLDDFVFLLVLAGSRTAEVDGISDAGATKESRRYTAIADAEFILNGPSLSRNWSLPPLPAGVSPALISYVSSSFLDVKPLVVAAGLTITALQSLISRQLDPFKSAVLSITKIEGGSAFNVIPDIVTIGGTLRSTDQKNRNEMLDKIEKVASHTCAISNCEVNIEIRPGYPPTINNKECAKLASKIFKKTYGDNSINLKETPTMGSEDFSYMLEEKPGAYIWLGAGASSEKLHSPFYDFNDELLPIGAQYWTDLAENILVEQSS